MTAALDPPQLALVPAPPDAVPSVLPETGFDLERELARYRDWMITQALALCHGNRTAAAARLGMNRTTLVETLRRSVAVQRLKRKTEAAAAAPKPGPKLLALADRIPWDLVAMLRAEGKSESRICRILANKLESHPYTIEKALRQPRPLAKCGP